MLASSRPGLDYYETHFSPYQFRQFRIMEFPRYRTFAQSFSNTVPFSEAIGFITRLRKPTDVDLTYFVTAHELGHQWWGHQLVGGRVEGSNMMSETLAQYSAYMVMQQKYGKDYMHRVLRYFLDRYLRGRAGEVRHEPPLALVQREPYVWYDKGGQIMYTLADYIGEEQIDRALHNFLMRYRYANADNQVDAVGGADARMADRSEQQPYPDTRMLVEALRARDAAGAPIPDRRRIQPHRPVRQQDAIRDLQEDWPTGATRSASRCRRARCSPTATASSTPMPLADYIDIGVFKGAQGRGAAALHAAREDYPGAADASLSSSTSRPTRAGIDPYNKLIDRIPDDNMIDVSTE